MSKRPPYGLCLPVIVDRVIDGDTIAVQFRKGGLRWRIRLRGVNCPEVKGQHKAHGLAAKEYVKRLLVEKAETLAVHIEPPDDPDELLNMTTFNRLVGEIWLDNDTKLSDVLVASGHAKRRQ
mgnify:CR=1 FL=1